MEQLIKDLEKAWEQVQYHDDRANRDKAIAYLDEMRSTCDIIKDKCNQLDDYLNHIIG